MRRRDFLVLTGLASLSPLMARAQSVAEPVVGVVFGTSESDPAVADFQSALEEGLAQLGWRAGENVRLEIRFAEGDRDRARAIAEEMVQLMPDVIVVGTTPVAEEVSAATIEIPIVFNNVSDPIGSGLVTNFSQPEGNITGIANLDPALPQKWVELLRVAAPDASRIALLFNPSTAPGAGGTYWEQFARTAAAIGLTPVQMAVSDLEGAVAQITDFGLQTGNAIVVSADVFTYANRRALIEAINATSLPAMYPFRAFASEGGMMAYGIDPIDPLRLAGNYAGEILNGTPVGDLPVRSPQRFELVINLTRLNALGIVLPPDLIAQATEIVE